MAQYNGWKNRATWNIALWLGNDEGLYNACRRYVEDCRKRGVKPMYRKFLDHTGLEGERTPDGYLYAGRGVSYRELSGFLREL